MRWDTLLDRLARFYYGSERGDTRLSSMRYCRIIRFTLLIFLAAMILFIALALIMSRHRGSGSRVTLLLVTLLPSARFWVVRVLL